MIFEPCAAWISAHVCGSWLRAACVVVVPSVSAPVTSNVTNSSSSGA